MFTDFFNKPSENTGLWQLPRVSMPFTRLGNQHGLQHCYKSRTHSGVIIVQRNKAESMGKVSLSLDGRTHRGPKIPSPVTGFISNIASNVICCCWSLSAIHLNYEELHKRECLYCRMNAKIITRDMIKQIMKAGFKNSSKSRFHPLELCFDVQNQAGG